MSTFKFCSECGERNAGNFKFCPECGHKLIKEVPAKEEKTKETPQKEMKTPNQTPLDTKLNVKDDDETQPLHDQHAVIQPPKPDPIVKQVEPPLKAAPARQPVPQPVSAAKDDEKEIKTAPVKNDSKPDPIPVRTVKQPLKRDFWWKDSYKKAIAKQDTPFKPQAKAVAVSKDEEKEIKTAAASTTPSTNTENTSDSHSDASESSDHDFHLRFEAHEFVPKTGVKRKAKSRRKGKTSGSKVSKPSSKIETTRISPDIESKPSTKTDKAVAETHEEKTKKSVSASRFTDVYMVCNDAIDESAWNKVKYVADKESITYMHCHDECMWPASAVDERKSDPKYAIATRYKALIVRPTHTNNRRGNRYYKGDKVTNAEEDMKHVLCRFYGSAKGCPHGAHCNYSHANPNSVKLCDYYTAEWGTVCPHGNVCRFRHKVWNQDSLEDHDIAHSIINKLFHIE
eukprot:198163_1